MTSEALAQTNASSNANGNPKGNAKPQKQADCSHLIPHRWRKGQSGNPGGRPEGAVSITKIIRECCRHGGAEMAVASMMEVLSDPNHKHFAAMLGTLLERMDGKVGSQLEDALLKRLQEGISLNTSPRPDVELPLPQQQDDA